MKKVVVNGAFDNLSPRQVRFLHEASRLGELTLYLWADETVQAQTGAPPKSPLDERQHLLESLRFVHRVEVIWPQDIDALPYLDEDEPPLWVVDEAEHNQSKRLFAVSFGLGYQVLEAADLEGWPQLPLPAASEKKKVLVSGSYDPLHSGHVRFFEEAAQLGELYVAVEGDASQRQRQGENHPLFGQDQRRYMVQAVRFVHQALIAGDGWPEAAPEMAALKPDIYVVNQDDDHPEIRRFCQEHGLEYVVLKRLPRPGLPRRVGAELRGF